MAENQGKKLQKALDNAGKTQQDLANHLQIAVRTVSRWINEGTTIKDKYRASIATFLAIDPLWLFHDEDPAEDVNPVVEHYDAFLRHTPFPMAMFTSDHRFMVATGTFIRGFRMEKYQPLEGRHVTEVFPKPSRDSAAYLKKAGAGGTPSKLEAEQFEYEDGTKYWLAYRTVTWKRKSGLQGGYLVICSFGNTKEDVERVANIAYDERGMPKMVYNTSVGNGSIAVTKSTHKPTGENAYTSEEDVLVSFQSSSLIDAISTILSNQIPEGELDTLLDDADGVLHVRVTEFFRRIDGKNRKISVNMEISNATPKAKPKRNGGANVETGWRKDA